MYYSIDSMFLYHYTQNTFKISDCFYMHFYISFGPLKVLYIYFHIFNELRLESAVIFCTFFCPWKATKVVFRWPIQILNTSESQKKQNYFVSICSRVKKKCLPIVLYAMDLFIWKILKSSYISSETDFLWIFVIDRKKFYFLWNKMEITIYWKRQKMS